MALNFTFISFLICTHLEFWNLPKGNLEFALELGIDFSRIGIGIDKIKNKPINNYYLSIKNHELTSFNFLLKTVLARVVIWLHSTSSTTVDPVYLSMRLKHASTLNECLFCCNSFWALSEVKFKRVNAFINLFFLSRFTTSSSASFPNFTIPILSMNPSCKWEMNAILTVVSSGPA